MRASFFSEDAYILGLSKTVDISDGPLYVCILYAPKAIFVKTDVICPCFAHFQVVTYFGVVPLCISADSYVLILL